MRPRGLAVALLTLAAATAAAQDRVAIPIAVRNGTGQPIAGAVVGVRETGASGTTDAFGRADVLGHHAKNHLRVRALGFAPLDTTAALPEDGAIVVIQLRSLQTLSAMDVYARRFKPSRYDSTRKFDLFYERRPLGFGSYFTRDDIERSGVMHASDLMTRVTGVKVFRQQGRLSLTFPRCELIIGGPKKPPAVFVDGNRISDAGDPMDVLYGYGANEIEAMEVYRSSSELPVDARGDACSAIYIWTRYTGGSVLNDSAKKP